MAAQCLPTYATDEWVSLCCTLALLLEAWLLPAGFPTYLVLESFSSFVQFPPRSSSGKVSFPTGQDILP